MNTLVRLFNRLFNIKTREWPRVLILYSMAFLFIAGSTWGGLYVQAAFLFEVGVENLPQVLVANALLSIVAIAVYTPFVDRITNDKLLIAISIIGAAAIGIGYALLGLGMSGIAYPLLYTLSIIVRQTFNLQWWTYVNSFYDTRSAKRIIPVLATAARVGIIVAGQTIASLNAALTPSSNIILLWLGALLIIALITWLSPRLFKETRSNQFEHATFSAPTRDSKRASSFTRNIREGYHYVSQSPFLRWMAFSTLFMMLLFALLEYYTSYIFVQSGNFGSGGELSSFLGHTSSWASLILLPFQLFLLSRLVGRMGLGNANLIFPTSTLAICGALIGWPQVSTATLGYLDRRVFRSVFRNPPDNLLYNAVPLRVKGRARAFIGGLIAPIGSLAGGGLLLLLPLVPAEWFLPALIGVSTVAYIISAFVVRRQYSQALITMLEQEDFSFLLSSASELAITDSTTLNWLTKKLDESPSADFTIFMAKLISEVGGSKAIPILAQVAKAGDPRVRSTVIDILAASGVRGEAVLQVYTEFLDDPDGRVRRSAIAGLEQAAGAASEWFLNHALDMLPDPDVDVRAQVIPPLARSGDFFYLASAIQSLSQLVEGENPNLRARGVRVLGQVGDARFIRNLVQYLDDPDGQVRIEAITAIETLSRDQVPDQIAALTVKHLNGLVNDPVEQVRRAAVTILQRIDIQVAHQVLVRFLADPAPQIREATADALVQVGAPIIPILSPALDAADPQLRKMPTVILSRIDRERFGHLIQSRIDDSLLAIYYNYNRLKVLSPCADCPSISVLQSMLREQNHQLTGDIFYLLAAVHDPEAVDVIADSLENETARVRANAVEALEALTTPRLAKLIAPLFDPDPSPAQLLRLSEESWEISYPDTTKVIRQLATDPDDPWLRAVMTFALGEMGATLQREKEQSDARAAEPDKSRPAKSLDALTGALMDTEERKRHKPRRPSPADLLDKLIGDSNDDSQPSDQEKPKMRRPRPSAPLDRLTYAYGTAYGQPPLPLEEIESMLEAALGDPVSDVRIAARTANRMIAGLRVTYVTQEEETMLSTIERVIFLKEVPFFQGMTVDQLKVLANICEEEFFAKDTQIFEQDDPGGVLYVIVSGRVAIEREAQRKGSVVRLATMDAHSYFGEMSLFDQGPRSAAARAIQDTLTLRLRREPLVALVHQYPDLSLELINVLSQRVREANDKIAQLTRSRPRELDKLYDKLV
ncbi:MAG: hypothetical protein DRJ03_06560 [Chloroflexi bacterium]|nr:MAG: hypothetical protein B6I35_02215 [Anaerolineaceae bacterium 4572_32.2]RLC81541.1 MAG: hypothetical protein DRI81_02170 [Chloroflexota bacterium]RLC87237.1 MAG: hypothetical protein DRJ03_06560 [Chloroflexota bacterium]